MKKENITKFKLDPRNSPKSDWHHFDSMTDEQRREAARSDPDARPATARQLASARRTPNLRALRERLELTQEEFAKRFHLPLGTIRDWEQGAHRPDRAAQILLQVIAKNPDAVAKALAD
jgi:putative transcriptional regulator